MIVPIAGCRHSCAAPLCRHDTAYRIGVGALRPAIGANAIWVMCVPYMMIHLPKLWLEASGAILFGLFLGILALRSRSIWGGVLVHAGVAVSMDVVSLVKRGSFPYQLMQ